MSDTVGFIRKLPHQLVESFKSTLDETREADILVHVIDISHASFEDQYRIVQDTLTEIGSVDKPTITVFNKIDAYSPFPSPTSEFEDEKEITLEEIKQTWMSRISGDVAFVSVLKKQNMEELRKLLYEKVHAIHSKRYPYNNYYY